MCRLEGHIVPSSPGNQNDAFVNTTHTVATIRSSVPLVRREDICGKNDTKFIKFNNFFLKTFHCYALKI